MTTETPGQPTESPSRNTVAPFTWDELEAAQPTIIHAGQWGNSTVLRARLHGREWAVKTYRRTHPLYRRTIGRFWSRREYLAVAALEGNPGIPRRACRLDPCTFCCSYEPGRTLVDILKQRGHVAPEFFVAWEHAVQAMHTRGICHLDLRNGRNTLVLENGQPLMLDFQSCLRLNRLPPPLRRLLMQIDTAGVYKWWYRLSPETLDPARLDRLQRQNRARILWPFKGYGSWLRVWRAKRFDPPDRHSSTR